MTTIFYDTVEFPYAVHTVPVIDGCYLFPWKVRIAKIACQLMDCAEDSEMDAYTWLCDHWGVILTSGGIIKQIPFPSDHIFEPEDSMHLVQGDDLFVALKRNKGAPMPRWPIKVRLCIGLEYPDEEADPFTMSIEGKLPFAPVYPSEVKEQLEKLNANS